MTDEPGILDTPNDPGEDDGPLPIVDDDVAEAVPADGDGEVIVPDDEPDPDDTEGEDET